MDQKETFDWMRSELDRLREENAHQKTKINVLEAEQHTLQILNTAQSEEIGILRAQLAEMQKPVTDEEWRRTPTYTSRAWLDRLFAARAAKAQKGTE